MGRNILIVGLCMCTHMYTGTHTSAYTHIHTRKA